MRKLAPLLLLLISVTALLQAQTFNVEANHLPLVSLDGLWHFHTGDDPAWANPTFDDSRWPLLRSDQNWTSQGYPGYSGLAWYRFQVTVPANIDQASILLPEIDNSYEVFADGKLIGSFGKMPPHAAYYGNGSYYKVYALPAAPSGSHSERKLKIALRVWLDPSQIAYGSGPDAGGGLVGDTKQLIQRRDYALSRAQWRDAGTYTVALLQTLAGLGALILFLLRRKESEYLWFSILMFATAAAEWINFSVYSVAWNNNVLLFTWAFPAISGLASIAFYHKLLQPKRFWLMKLAAASQIFVGFAPLFQLFPPDIRIGLGIILTILLQLPLQIWILFVLFVSVRKRSIDARLLLAPVAFATCVDIFLQTAVLTDFLGWQHKFRFTDIEIASVPFRIELRQVAAVLFLLAVFGILVLRFARTRSEQERYATEVEGARHVQQFLIPEDLPQIPGLVIESDYRPAREVGGDFFQVIPNPEDGSALILVGDVAGKGMQAGMLATLLVGAMRTAATFTRDPAVILSTLNNRLHGKGNATCLALRIDSSGAATLVNAGHLPPYLNDQELPMEGALPLGTIPNNDFPILHFKLAEGDTLTLITDGILEAQKPDGELFGFDRITEQLRQSTNAASLADAAQSFGQDDDITVLTITRVAQLVAA
jgi:sigma-B regulation protein RsbU (phosphoserine phosphatase)